jgi:hypothetical protein
MMLRVLETRSEHDFLPRLLVHLYGGSIPLIAAGYANAVSDFTEGWITSCSTTYDGLAAEFAMWAAFSLLCVLIYVCAPCRPPYSTRLGAYLDGIASWLACYLLWYPLASALTYLPGYENLTDTGVLYTLLIAVITTVILALVAAALGHVAAMHEVVPLHLSLIQGAKSMRRSMKQMWSPASARRSKRASTLLQQSGRSAGSSQSGDGREVQLTRLTQGSEASAI